MRRILIALIGTLAFCLPITGAASAGAHHAHNSGCEQWAGFVHPSLGEGGAEWTCNTYGWQERGEVRCSNGIVSYHYGGIVTAVDLISWADCPAGYAMTNAYIQHRANSSYPWTRVQFWP
jgi:hypothetical protein